MTTGRRALLGIPAGTLAVGAPRRRRRSIDPERALEGRPARTLPLEGPQHAVRRAGSCTGRRVAHVRRRTRSCTRIDRRRSARSGWPRERAAILALADGTCSAAAPSARAREATGEVVFNTSMTGYQEILTDPSYEGQIVAMTYPQIGNVGVNREDVESRAAVRARLRRARVPRRAVAAGAPRRRSATTSRGTASPASTGIDTRALVRHLRDHGAQEAVLSTRRPRRRARSCARAKDAPSMDGQRPRRRASPAREPYGWTQGPWTLAGYASVDDVAERRGKPPLTVVAYDYGIKRNILREPGRASASRVTRRAGADAGARGARAEARRRLPLERPGRSRRGRRRAARTSRELLGKVPVFGICLGHQILGLALGGKTYKLKFGHHGGNQPVKDLTTGKVEITVAEPRLRGRRRVARAGPRVEVTHVNLNDQHGRGPRTRSGQPTFSVQYHPEASPGPHDARLLVPALRRR